MVCHLPIRRSVIHGILVMLREASVRSTGSVPLNRPPTNGRGAGIEERLASPVDWQVVLDTIRRTARVPELLGLGPHLLAVGERDVARTGS
jgi:hypothetical protein